jgi:uncharacterized DUF497 family protein
MYIHMYTKRHEVRLARAQASTDPEKHGLDFADAEQVFNGPTFMIENAGDSNGRRRFNTAGFLDSDIVLIRHTKRPTKFT